MVCFSASSAGEQPASNNSLPESVVKAIMVKPWDTASFYRILARQRTYRQEVLVLGSIVFLLPSNHT